MNVSYYKGDNGFSIHKITPATGGFTSGKASAYFDKDGKLIDVELFDRLGRSRTVKHGGPVWRTIARLGPIYKKRKVIRNPFAQALQRSTSLTPHLGQRWELAR